MNREFFLLMEHKFENFLHQKITERKIILILCFILLLVGFFLFLGINDAKECVGNPFVYGANEIVNEKTGSIYCACSFASPDYARFYFDNDSIGVIDTFEGIFG